MPRKTKSKMMSRSDAQAFLFKVDMEGLSYAVKNYAPTDTGDERFDKLLEKLRAAQEEMEDYIEEIREVYNIEVS